MIDTGFQPQNNSWQLTAQTPTNCPTHATYTHAHTRMQPDFLFYFNDTHAHSNVHALPHTQAYIHTHAHAP